MNTTTPEQSSPLSIVNQRMAAHNRHDLDAFLATYSDDIQVYDYPRTPLGKKGKAHITSIFEPLFTDNAVTTDIHHQIEHGDYVITMRRCCVAANCSTTFQFMKCVMGSFRRFVLSRNSQHYFGLVGGRIMPFVVKQRSR